MLVALLAASLALTSRPAVADDDPYADKTDDDPYADKTDDDPYADKTDDDPYEGISEDPHADARAKGEEGLALFAAKQFNSAYAAFAKADQLYHAPTLTLYQARCMRELGRLIDARRLYTKVVQESLTSTVPVQFRKAQESARSELSQIAPRIPVLRIKVRGAPLERVQLLVDGVLVPRPDWDRKEINPGNHVIVALADGFEVIRKMMLIKEGSKENIELQLKQRPAPLPRVQQGNPQR
jgi:tetratricopeptide (TPR) repeat protein